MEVILAKFTFWIQQIDILHVVTISWFWKADLICCRFHFHCVTFLLFPHQDRTSLRALLSVTVCVLYVCVLNSCTARYDSTHPPCCAKCWNHYWLIVTRCCFINTIISDSVNMMSNVWFSLFLLRILRSKSEFGPSENQMMTSNFDIVIMKLLNKNLSVWKLPHLREPIVSQNVSPFRRIVRAETDPEVTV